MLLPTQDRSARRLALSLLLAGPFLFGLWAVLLGQDGNWDLRNYHWYNAYAFLTGRWGMDVAPAQVASFYNPTLDLPFFMASQVLPARVVEFLLGSIQGANLVLLYGLAWTVQRSATPERRRVLVALAVAVCGMVGGGQVGLLGTTFYDNVISLFVLGGILVAVGGEGAAWSAPNGPAFRRVVLAGLLVGSGVGLKQPTIVFAVGTCAAFLAAGGTPWRRLLLAFFFGLGVLAGMAIFSGHWMWFLWSHFQNPLFPYFNNVFHSPWGTPDPYRDDKFIPKGPVAAALFPFAWALDPKLVGEIVFRDYRVLAAYVVLLLTGLMVLARWLRGQFAAEGPPVVDTSGPARARRYLLLAGSLSYLVWLKLFAIYRYLIPLEMLAPVLILAAVALWPAPARARGIITAVLLLLLAATGQSGTWARVPWGDRPFGAKVSEVQAPVLPRPDHTVILMTGYAPTSFLIPGFPPQIPFLRVQSYFIHPDQGDILLNRQMRRRIDQGIANGDDFYLLLAHWETWTMDQILPRYGLKGAGEPCQPVTSTLDEPMMLCRIIPLQPAANRDMNPVN
ncbi:hypothetical protein [Nitrospirillum sp. BR 11163]|uniref:hypothetical protein n=1 Tax=Nitrospirillum sp. BR 11163 TaxID=3104323 RepID=UPI002AFE7172|nr:hypothetical protein [Nitrospirillum sp. BR 11163]MEA1677075.1 hypothetical protein [Nitrospirillum sp. BR 11163]